MKSETLEINGIICKLTPGMVTVKYSYTIDYNDISRFCERLKVLTGSLYKRSAKSWKKELIAHNMLFNAGMFESHVADTDLDDHEKLYRLICYNILYFIHKALIWLNDEEED